jgi:hypothetical protein
MRGVVGLWRGLPRVGCRPVQGGNWNPCAAKPESCGTSVMSRRTIATTKVGAEFGPDMFISAPFQHQEVP